MYLPKVSIIIPVYNGEKSIKGANYLKEAIDSALAQTYKNIEILVINDGSKDNGKTEEVALSYGDKIRYLYKENGGVSSALNLGIKEMTGEYFSWLSHDDLYKPDKIEVQMKKVESEKDIAICSGEMIDSNGNIINRKSKKIDELLSGRELFKKVLNNYSLNGLGFLIHRSVFSEIGDFDISMRYLQDFDMWLRMMHGNYRFICHGDMLVKNRIHSMQVTNLKSEMFDTDREKLVIKHIDILNRDNTSCKEEFYKLYFLLSIKSGNKNGTRITRELLKGREEYNHSLRIQSFFIQTKGFLYRNMKNIYKNILKLKMRRDLL